MISKGTGDSFYEMFWPCELRVMKFNQLGGTETGKSKHVIE